MTQHDAVQLSRFLTPRDVYAATGYAELSGLNPLYVACWSLVTEFNQFDTILVLCFGDDEVLTGDTVYRLIGELLFGSRVVMIGPNATRAWPGGRGLLKAKRAREIVPLAATAGVGLF